MATETLEGVIERITYYGEETGYTVLRLKPSRPMPAQAARDGTVAVVGAFHRLETGESVRFSGEWVVHPEYGKQFKAEAVEQLRPSNIEGLKRYLGSGAIKGVGQMTAQNIIDHFGMEALDILDNTPMRLVEVKGINPTKAKRIGEEWNARHGTRQAMVFLQGHGLGPKQALKVVNTLGEDAVKIVKADPYRMMYEVEGIGFKTADQIARNLGLTSDSPQRIAAGIVFALETLGNDGHVYGPRALVVETVGQLLGLDLTPSIDYSLEDEYDQSEYDADSGLDVLINAPTDVPTGTPDAGPDAMPDAGPNVMRAEDEFDPWDEFDDEDEDDDGVSSGPVRLSALKSRAQGAQGTNGAKSKPKSIENRISDGIETLRDQGLIYIQSVPDAEDPNTMIEALYSRPLFFCEVGAAKRIYEMVQTNTTRLHKAKTMSWIKFFSLLEKEDKVSLTEQQKGAVEAALTHKLSILTGGPGTGKTTTLRAVIRALDFAKAKYALASPTGRAAKRLSEATGRGAKTLHRLLGFMPGEGFTFTDAEPLDVDMLIIDESSMLDLSLFYNVLKCLTPDTHLMLVGDVDQLPSVGAGDVLRDLIKSGVAHVTRLDAIFRQSEDSQIITNAHRINSGETPVLDNQSSDFFMFTEEDVEKAASRVVDVVCNRIPDKFGFDPLNDVQVLVPMYRGAAGIQVLNERLQAALNPPGRTAEKKINGVMFRVGDKVLQTKNNYDKDVYNGDIGHIVGMDFLSQKVHVMFDERPVEYTFNEMAEVLHAFAVSVHRSQGSEYPVVVLPVMMQHFMMLQRNLLYTAVTRAKKLVVLVGSRRAVGVAVRNNKVTQRYTALAWRLIRGR